MAKSKTMFFCKECGFESTKWLGQCPGCKVWDSFTEEKIQPVRTTQHGRSNKQSQVTPISKVELTKDERIQIGIEEFDRVLGGGIVIGSLVLVGGDPGIGKSTLLLQMCQRLAKASHRILYISGEESASQIKMRADRIGDFNENLLLLSETNLNIVDEIIPKIEPKIIIIDSIQTMYKEEVNASCGSVSQVKEATNYLMHMAKDNGITIFIVGHVTKEGTVAGPRVLEHMVDTVLYFEGENQVSYRILRAVKNRFGSTNEIGVFEMKQEGLEEVKNPSLYMLQGKPVDEPGSVITCAMEGTRPILVEIQSLICRTSFNLPRRTSAGTDFNRVNLLLAVLEKRLGLKLAECDAYVNVAGGMKLTEPSVDLALVSAIMSSYRNISVDNKTIIFGEVGLTGEVRAVSHPTLRLTEALKMGFSRVIMPAANASGLEETSIKVVGVHNVKELFSVLFQQG